MRCTAPREAAARVGVPPFIPALPLRTPEALSDHIKETLQSLPRGQESLPTKISKLPKCK